MGIIQNFKEADRQTKRKYLLLLLLVLLFFVGVVLTLRLLRQEAQEEQPTIPEPIVVTQEMLLRQQELTINPVAIQEGREVQMLEADLRIIAEPFLARFGSYNNQDGFRNINELTIYTTASFQQWIDTQYKAQLQAQMPTIDTYYAINTKVLASEGIEFRNQEETVASIRFTTQREVVRGILTEAVIEYQDARVNLEKINETWKVSGVFWL